MSSIKKAQPYQDKEKTVLQKYLTNNHITPTKPDQIIKKKYKVTPETKQTTQSKLPIAVQQSKFRHNNIKPSIKKKSLKNVSFEDQNEDKKTTPAKKSEIFEEEIPDFLKFHKNENSSDDEQLVHMNRLLERFRNSKPLPREERSNLTVANLASSDSSVDISNSDGEASNLIKMNENKEIESLKKRLNNLRKKMYSNKKIDETYNYDDEDSLDPSKIQKSKSAVINSVADSLDMKARYLIERSESSLTDRNNSSDGLGSSRSSSICTSLSFNFQEPQPYKPEFLKYLENKNKLDFSPVTGEQINPEEDILYQWRLRRKMEETKNQSSFTTLDSSSNTSNIIKPISKPTQIEIKTINDENFTSKTIKNDSKPLKNQTIETQTSISIERFEQKTTTIETNTLPCISEVDLSKTTVHADEDEHEIELNIENEEPTRDRSDYLENSIPIHINSKKPKEPIQKSKQKDIEKNKKDDKKNFLSSSPIKEKNRRSIDFILKTPSVDLTKVSTIAENTPHSVPNKSNSPIHFNQQAKSKINMEPYKSIPSVMSSVSSTMTNVTQFNHPVSVSGQFDRLSVDTAQSNTANTQMRMSSKIESSPELDIYQESLGNEIDKEMIESDEILRILFKKNYFYKLKLKQIDELITK